MLQSIFVPFLTILVAEFLDKSQVSILFLASKTRHHLQLFLGTVLAFMVVDGLAIVFGSWLTSVVPESTLKLVAGVGFIVFGILAFRSTSEEKNASQTRNSVLVSGFTLVFLSEWGDKTQLASAIFATRYNTFFVFVGVMMALALLSFVAIYVGSALSKRINKTLISRISGVVFILLGIFFLLF